MRLALLPKEMNLAIGVRANLIGNNSIFIHHSTMDHPIALRKRDVDTFHIYIPLVLDELN